ncbi:spermidine synthase [Myroides gitamensis]|nr:spermidine synthase [Myroides gitamensis]
MLKKWLSYVTPIPVKKITSKINHKLEITWQNGQLVLDTKNTNYSYGQLEQVFKKAFKFIGYPKIKPMQQVLNLGLGAGSTVHLLRNDINFTGSMTSIELDEAIIYVARKYFNLDRYQANHQIIQMDAFEYVLTCQEQYDLIVIDIFQDSHMPSFLFEHYFLLIISNNYWPLMVLLFSIRLSSHQKMNSAIKPSRHYLMPLISLFVLCQRP